VLDNILQAAFCVPDHHCLSPWRFVVCTGDGLDKLGNIFKRAAVAKSAPQATLERAPQLPKRAPMVVVAICDYKAHEKVPRVEQLASTACAVQAMQMAAIAQGFQGIWRTGWYAFDTQVKNMLKCKEDDEILGFLYLGSSPLKASKRQAREPSAYVEYWS
jgi:nitroreductase